MESSTPDPFTRPSNQTHSFLQPHAGAHTAEDCSYLPHVCLHAQTCVSSLDAVYISIVAIRNTHRTVASSQPGDL